MKTNSQSNILITTALTDTWGNSDQKAFLLGEWCKTMQNESLLSLKDYNQLPHHWSDRKKFIKDYEYLESFYERVLKSLADHLNKYHGTKHTLRYWRILLGPWLLTYVAIVWERWESLRLAFEGKDFDEVHFLKLNRDSLVPSDYNAFRVYNMLDHWNHHLFSEIIRYQYSDQINVKYLNQDENAEIDIRIDIDDIQPTKGKILGFIDRCLSIQKKYKVVFVEPYFDRLSFLSLALRLKQLPRGHYEFFQKINYPSVNEDRYSRSIQINATNDFEIFFQQHIFSQIPIAYLEGYKELNRVAESIKTRGEIIFTANAHLDNDLFNCWAGDQVEKGKRLVVSQHGGAIRSNYTNFDHQEKIADSMTVWHKPYMNNHIQLTPNKLISGFRQSFFKSLFKKPNNNLTLVGFETSRYSFRAQAGPFAKNYSEDYEQKIQFVQSLKKNIVDDLTIRSFSRGNGWTRSKDRYASDLGHDKISNSSTLKEAFAYSKIVVCTYPQTTFSEAMHSNIPTILLFCEEHWPLHPQFDGLIEKLKQNNIIFTDPIKAAEHINQVWDNPDEWWHDSSTREAVNYFFKMCGNVSDDWVNEWASFFEGENHRAIIETEGLIERDAQGYLSIKIQFKMILMNIFTSFIQLFLPLLRTKIGRVILEIVSNDLMSNIREIEHNDIKLSFLEMNRLTKFRIDTFSTKEPETLDWIDSFEEESVFWDIGANIGLYTCYAAKKHNCNTIAFEPSVFNLELLARNVWANDLKTQITIIPLPLTELIKTADMSMSNTDHGGALSTFGEDYGPDGESLNASFEYKMMGLSMDDAVNIFDLPSPNHIKIDVDGIEHLILKGGDQVLTNADSILIEINDAFIEQAQRTNQYLERSGFMLKEKTHAEHYDNVVLFKGIEGTTYNQIWVKKVNN